MARVAAAAAAAAASGAAALGDCDPLVPEYCMLPFPNDFYLRDGKTNFSDATFPKSNGGKPIRAGAGGWNSLDGFSPLGAIVTYWPDASLAGLPRIEDVAGSLASDARTVLLDAESGERVAHWVELDHSSDVSGKKNATLHRALMLWPAARLRDSRRYIVAIRGAVSLSGAALPASAAFTSLRDGNASQDPDVEARRAHFDSAVFAPLTAAGVDRASLQLAWDFTTNSKKDMTQWMLHMRDDGMQRVGAAAGPLFKVTSTDANYSALIARRVQGTFKVPLYTNTNLPGAKLVLGGDGLPAFQKFVNADFTVLIPHTAAGRAAPSAVLQYGHGLFGSQSEVQTGYLQNVSATYGYVLAATDWLGMAELDAVAIAAMMADDFTDFRIVPERCHQGMLNALLLMKLMTTPAFQADPSMALGGAPVLAQDSPLHYYGNSQGGIYGTVYMALSTQVSRGTIGVGGLPYTMLLPRSSDFSTLFTAIKLRYSDPVDRIQLFQVMQLLWDRLEPAPYSAYIAADPLPGTPAHQVLHQWGVGDAQVTNFADLMLARSVGASIFASQVRIAPDITNWGLPVIADDTESTGPVSVGWDFPGTKPVPHINVPASDDTDAHEKPRRQPDAQRMMADFFATGKIRNTCGGPCHGFNP